MRDIFFRLWDRKDKVFWMPRYGGFGFDLYYHPRKPERESLSALMGVDQEKYKGENRFIAQQYTGLLDKNAKAIFEGDILKGRLDYDVGHNVFIGKVIFAKHCKYQVRLSNKNGDFTPELDDNFKIIGNIFENPKLLKC